MEQLTKMLKIILLVLLFSSVCYSIYPKKRILDNLDKQNKPFQNAPTSSSSRIIESHNQPSTSGVQHSIPIRKKTYETYVGENGKKKYVCNDCSYQTSAPSTASRHWYAEHGSRIFKCATCDYESSQKSHVKQHQRIVHQGLKGFRCDYCEYAASTKQVLTYHVNSRHLNLKKYKCTQCQYESAQKGNLKKHVNNIHPNPQ